MDQNCSLLFSIKQINNIVISFLFIATRHVLFKILIHHLRTFTSRSQAKCVCCPCCPGRLLSRVVVFRCVVFVGKRQQSTLLFLLVLTLFRLFSRIFSLVPVVFFWNRSLESIVFAALVRRRLLFRFGRFIRFFEHDSLWRRTSGICTRSNRA